MVPAEGSCLVQSTNQVRRFLSGYWSHPAAVNTTEVLQDAAGPPHISETPRNFNHLNVLLRPRFLQAVSPEAP
ncbi:hypothetical protein AGIG_G23416 [Arapaima gigas]